MTERMDWAYKVEDELKRLRAEKAELMKTLADVRTVFAGLKLSTNVIDAALAKARGER